MCPDYPIGTRRLILEIGYYPCFNQPHVSLHDMREDPIVAIDETGIRTGGKHYALDAIVFALGFKPFLGAIDTAGVVNPAGRTPRDVWARGPRTVFGLMTPGFPNFFHTTNAGSPSVLGPLILENEFHIDWIADCLAEMARRGREVVEPTEEGADIGAPNRPKSPKGCCAARSTTTWSTSIPTTARAYSSPGARAW